jgi:hypothetical protein
LWFLQLLNFAVVYFFCQSQISAIVCLRLYLAQYGNAVCAAAPGLSLCSGWAWCNLPVCMGLLFVATQKTGVLPVFCCCFIAALLLLF